MLCAFSVIGKEPTNHFTNCLFCMVPPIQKGITKKYKGQWSFQIHHRLFVQCLAVKGLPIPVPNDSFSLDCYEKEKNTPEDTP